MSIKMNLHIDLDIDDLEYRYTLKNELKEALDIIPVDKGMNAIRTFLENLMLRL